MRSRKGSHRILVRDVEYRWRATGNDGYISVGIWPENNIGPYIQGNFRYHETWIDEGKGQRSSAGDQIVVTNRIVERIVEYAITARGYDPCAHGKELNLQVLDEVIKWDDAVRASPTRTASS